MRNALFAVACAVLSLGRAETTVSDVIVNQRWPWSEKVDVDFTLTGEKADVDVTATWDGQTAPVLIGTAFDAISGHNRVTWDPAGTPWAGQTLTGFSVTLAPASAAAHTYLVVDLQNGGVSYLAEPDGTDGRWSDAYKTTRMVFRRIPAGTYQLGMTSNDIARAIGGPFSFVYARAWKRHDATFTSDFYVGVFKLTRAQYDLLEGTTQDNPLYAMKLSYDELRGSTADGINWPWTKYEVSTNSLLAKLRAKAGKGIVVDLCHECQWEAAMRAGTTTYWPNGGTADDGSEVLGALVDAIAWPKYEYDVGGKAANAWGIYDSVGLVSDWTLGTTSGKSGAASPSVGVSSPVTDYVGAYVESPTWRVVRGSSSMDFNMLPCVRQIISPSSKYSASTRLCIHLKPLNFTK